MSQILIHLNKAGNDVTCLVGRRKTPLADADAGVQVSFDRAVTAHDGAVAGPLATGPWFLDTANDTLCPAGA